MRIILTLAILLSAACPMNEKKVRLYEEFTLKNGENVRVISTNLYLKLVGTGLQENDEGAPEFFCIVDLTFNEQTERKELKSQESATIGNFNVKAEDVEFKKSCSFFVTVTN
jgi:hypothetical protein